MEIIPADKCLFKQQLRLACAAVLLKRVETAEAAMQHAQESANSEEKSTAGDKYETARAVGQLDRDMNAKQWHEARKEYTFLQAIDTDTMHQAIGVGSVAGFDGKLFYMAAGAGVVEASSVKVTTLSVKSPLFMQLQGKRAGDTILFQSRPVTIDTVF